MSHRALSTARTLTGTAVVATALGTAVLGVHLATDSTGTPAVGTAASWSSSDDGSARQQPPPHAPQQGGGGLLGFTGFGRLPAPGAGSHSSSHGS